MWRETVRCGLESDYGPTKRGKMEMDRNQKKKERERDRE